MAMTKEQKLKRGAELIREETDTEQNVTINPTVNVGDEVTLSDDCVWVDISGVSTKTVVVHTEGENGVWVWVYDEDTDDVHPIFANDIVQTVK